MRVTYDRKAQALYIRVIESGRGEGGKCAELVGDTIIMDKTRFGQISGIEILGVAEIEDITDKGYSRSG